MISEENPKPRSINIIRERLNASASYFANVNNNGNANNNGASNTRDGLRPLVIENIKSSQPMAQRGIVSCPKGKFDSGCGRLRLNAIHRI